MTLTFFAVAMAIIGRSLVRIWKGSLGLSAREAAQIFGGNSYIRGGQGEKIERLYREVRATAIPGGSEEIMIDLAVRQILKPIKKL